MAPYAGHLTISTSAWIGCEVPFKRTDVFHQVASVPGLRAGSYLVANNHETAGVCLQWLRDSVGSSESTDLDGSAGYERLTALGSLPRWDPAVCSSHPGSTASAARLTTEPSVRRFSTSP